MLRGRTFESAKADGMYESKKVKRYRSAFTTSQINHLEKQFEKCPYIGSATRKEVANALGIQERAIKIWFQNRRMKEKKEQNNKEYNLDRYNNLMNNMEFAKDPLNNVHSSSSPNDHQCSLKSNTAEHVDKVNCKNYYNDVTFSNQIKTVNSIKEKNDNLKSYTLNDGNVANKIKQDDGNIFLREQRDLMKYTLKNHYNNKNSVKYLEIAKRGTAKNKLIPNMALKARSSAVGDPTLKVPTKLSRHQDLPEDLSARNFSNVVMPQNHQGNIHFSPYIPYCDTKNICLSAGNVIWNPVNVMPNVSNTMPITVQERPQTLNRNDLQKCKCNCDCHSRNRLNYEQGNIPQPQYVIAIPYNNNLSILR